VTTYTNHGIVIAGIVVGFFLVPMLADMSPTIVNSILLLSLLAALLMNSDKWLPYLKQFGNATSSVTATGTLNAAGTSGPPPTGH
jgi:hypothetical protein